MARHVFNKATSCTPDGRFKLSLMTATRTAFLRKVSQAPMRNVSPGRDVAQFVLCTGLAAWAKNDQRLLEITDLGKSVLAEIDGAKRVRTS